MTFSGQSAGQRQINPHAGIIFRAPPVPSTAALQFGEGFAAGAPPPEAAPPPAKVHAPSSYGSPQPAAGSSGFGPQDRSTLPPAPVSATMQQLLMRNWLMKIDESEFRALLLSLGNVYPSLVTAVEQELKRHQNQQQQQQQQQPATVPHSAAPGPQLNKDAKPFTPQFAAPASATSALY